jgi:UDP-glucose 4-epimerase
VRVLVTGGAGYIGSHVVRRLRAAGHEPFVLDDVAEGHRAAAGGVPLTIGDVADPAALDAAIADRPVDGVIHMAASCLVGESMERPGKYYENNLVRTLRLLDNMAARGLRNFVFSSTAAVYGDPIATTGATRVEPIAEDHPCEPANVYGETKLAVERALSWHARCAGLRAISLRYFNAAGADPAGDIGEDHDPETHLIPLVMKTALGRLPHVTVLGRDYPTPDGTCLRDYVHVNDLADAHVLALGALGALGTPEREGGFRAFNLGAGSATSVLELIAAARRITGREIPLVDGPRRAGDPPVLLASSDRIRAELGWKPILSNLDTILATAWSWHLGHPGGFPAAAAS